MFERTQRRSGKRAAERFRAVTERNRDKQVKSGSGSQHRETGCGCSMEVKPRLGQRDNYATAEQQIVDRWVSDGTCDRLV